MIRINKITTKTGDNGQTLGPGIRLISKFSDEIEFIGKIDELNSSLGQVLASTCKRKTKKLITEIQHQLFDIGSMFFKKDAIDCDKFIQFLEEKIIEYSKNVKALDSFLLPQGGLFKKRIVSSLHVARSCARSAERSFWKTVINHCEIEPTEKLISLNMIGVYLNRLSDLLFAIIRKNSRKKWIPMKRRLSI